MGFPLWTLFGMAITAFGALVMLVIAYIAQSPKLLQRLGLSGSRLDLRARTFTGYALALLLLAFGFFIAGVPLGPQPVETEIAAATAIVDTNESGAMAPIATATPEPENDAVETSEPSENREPTEPVTGAFAGPPPAAQTLQQTESGGYRPHHPRRRRLNAVQVPLRVPVLPSDRYQASLPDPARPGVPHPDRDNRSAAIMFPARTRQLAFWLYSK